MTYIPRSNKHQLRSEKTRKRILDAAELLFAPAGSAGVSMRQIAAAIDVDLSLVTYHFESKDALYHEVIDRTYRDFTNRRMKLLDAVELAKPNPTIIELFDVLITAWFEMLNGPNSHHVQLLYRGLNYEYHPDSEAEWISDPFAKRFLAAVCKAAPGFPESHIHWTYHLFTGAIVYCMNVPQRVRRLSRGICNIDSRAATRDALLRLVTDGFSLQASAAASRKRRTPKHAARRGGSKASRLPRLAAAF
jgi:AcrR family transcriptional regulator